MENKTCGDCRFLESAKKIGVCDKMNFCLCPSELPSCSKFEQKVVTNGDRIRQGGNRELAEIFDDFYNGNKCKYCINYISGNCKFDDKHAEYDEGGWVEDEDCISGIEAWLNAPADCVKQTGNHDTQTDLCKADKTESEVCNG